MEKLNYALLFIAAVFLATTAVLLTKGGQTIQVSTQNQDHKLDVQGMYEADVAPDKALIAIGIVTNSSTAKEAQDKNRQVASSILSALENVGLERSEIETQTYTVQPLKTYNYKTGAYDDHGYEVRNSMRITTKKLDVVSDAVDAASRAGANEINDIQFTLTDERESQVKSEFLGKAAASAKSKAQNIANAVGVTLKSPISISESFSYQPMYRSYAMEAKVAYDVGSAPSPTPISPGQVHVSSSVSVAYGIE